MSQLLRTAMRRRSAGLVILGAIALCPACGSTTAVHGRALASAGAAYGKAADLLLEATQNAAADADSARLLSEGQGLGKDDRRALLEKHAAVGQTIADLARLRRHERLLTRYFEAFGRLAQTDADTAAADATTAAASAINSLGKELTGSTLLTSAERDLASQSASLTVQAARRSAIERELAARGAEIDREIGLQKTVLDAVRRKLHADLESQATLGKERDVTKPFVDAAVGDAHGWIAARRASLLAPPGSDALTSASEAASKLRSAWRALVAGGFDETARQALLADVETMVSYAEAAKRVGQ